MTHKMPNMPIGIQMFATITSKDHFLTLKRDLQKFVHCSSYCDTTVYCSDGNLHYSRLIVGLVFPELKTITTFSLLPEISVLMPQYRKKEVERIVSSFLSMQGRQPGAEQEPMIGDWTESLDTIIDNLKPETISRDAPRTATLHSEVTKETVVLHAAAEDETEDVLVVAEDQSGEDVETRRTAPASQLVVVQPQYPQYQHLPIIQNLPGLTLQPSDGKAGGGQAEVRSNSTVITNKPLTYVPIPSKKDKSVCLPKQYGSSARAGPGPGYVPISSSAQLLQTRPGVLPVRQRPGNSRKSPGKGEQKGRLTQVSKVELGTAAEMKIPQPRTTEIRPVQLAGPGLSPAFSCPVCHEMFVAQDIMENHMKVHSDKHKCHTCGLVCIKARELIEHQRIHSGAKLVKCNICDKDFTEKGLRLHSERFHKILEIKSQNKRASKENYSQDKITFTSSSEDSDPDDPRAEAPSSEDDEQEPKPKQVKVKNVKLKRTEYCAPCEKYFTKKGIKLHQIRHHKSEHKEETQNKLMKEKGKKNPPLKKLFSCGFCEKKFSHLASMKVHEKVHLGGKPHQCDMCEAKFSNKFDLFTHEKTHSALRPHKCDECTETFKTSESLRFHKLIHEESQPNVCQFCKKTFKNKNQLDLHERVHVGEKPFHCNQCDQRFETASKLTRHITSTHMS